MCNPAGGSHWHKSDVSFRQVHMEQSGIIILYLISLIDKRQKITLLFLYFFKKAARTPIGFNMLFSITSDVILIGRINNSYDVKIRGIVMKTYRIYQ